MDLNFRTPGIAVDPLDIRPLTALARLALALLLTVTALGSLRAQSRASLQVEREAYLMGTRLRATVTSVSARAGMEAIEAAFAEVRRLEELLSSWREDSELARLGSAAVGVPFRPSAELFAVLREVRLWAERSGGAFDPAVGPLIDAWDMRGRGRHPSPAELAAALARSGLDGFAFDDDAGTIVRQREGSWMTAGGFGKGAALRAARRALQRAGIESALLEFGGQLLAIGPAPGGEDWTASVAHPSRRHAAAASIRLRGVSAATSAASERFIEVDGERLGHVLDPRAGRPVPAWGSVTVVTPDPLLADVLSTALFVMGPDEGMAWAARREGIGVLFLEEEAGDVVATWNPAMRPWLIAIGGRPLADHEAYRRRGPAVRNGDGNR